MDTSLHHSSKLEILNFFWILSLISWANTFKTQEFRQKFENFNHPIKVGTLFIMINYNGYLPASFLKTRDFYFFFGFCPSFCGLTHLKLKNFDKKLKISTIP